MKAKYLISLENVSVSKSYNASDKPKYDVEVTLCREGYNIINIPWYHDAPKLKRAIRFLYDSLRAIITVYINKPQEVMIQYSSLKATRLLLKLLKFQNITLLIHDIDSLRFNKTISEEEIKILNMAKKLLVHTQNMQGYLENVGVKSPMEILWLFDYYAKGEMKQNMPSENYEITFAGNLKKSEFLKRIGNILSPYIIHLYGLPIEYEWPDKILYEGKFEPDEINDIKGDWGLVWDGNSIEKCNGELGEYLRYNSSHKASLYLACGKPIIVWDESGLAEFVRENKIGITIKSLQDIPYKMKSISKHEYLCYTENVKIIQSKIRNGKMLCNVLRKTI